MAFCYYVTYTQYTGFQREAIGYIVKPWPLQPTYEYPSVPCKLRAGSSIHVAAGSDGIDSEFIGCGISAGLWSKL